MKDFNKLCTPAKIYFGIAVIATLFDLLNGVSFMFAFWKMVFAFVWTFILGGLCDKGYKSISWTLVLLPYILMFLASLNIYHVTDEQRQFMRSIQLQGAFGQEAFRGKARKAAENAAENASRGVANPPSISRDVVNPPSISQGEPTNLSESEVYNIVKEDFENETAYNLNLFKNRVKTWNNTSLNAVKLGLELEISSLKTQITNVNQYGAVNLMQKIDRQKAKLNIVNDEIQKRL